MRGSGTLWFAVLAHGAWSVALKTHPKGHPKRHPKPSVPIESLADPPKPHIIFMLADDLGWWDSSITGDQSLASKKATKNLQSLADAGMVLNQHYTHWHCSPTRRSFLSGRSTLHHGEQLSPVTADHIDLRWTWISKKLEDAGYVGHYYGKGHTGYQSVNHLPSKNGFSGGSVMFLEGSTGYYGGPRWNMSHFHFDHSKTYSTDYFGKLAVDAVERHNTSVPMFLCLFWQAVHAPYDYPPRCKQSGGTDECPTLLRAIIRSVDEWTGKLVDAVVSKGMYNNTLFVFTSDNGGTAESTTGDGGNNYPLRGGKHTQWEGGMRTTTFLSGGFLPENAQGTSHDGTFHIIDWYPTFCYLAGVDPTDDPETPPLPVDEAFPEQDIYGENSYPSIDGVNIWPELMGETNTSGREYLYLSEEVVIKGGRYKIVLAQQDPNLLSVKPFMDWREADGSWTHGGELDGPGCGSAYMERHSFRPCLFDLWADLREQNDLSASMPELVEELWGVLNHSKLHAFMARSPEELKGGCTEACAVNVDYPVCGLVWCKTAQAYFDQSPQQQRQQQERMEERERRYQHELMGDFNAD